MWPILKIEGADAHSTNFDQNLFSITGMDRTSKTKQIFAQWVFA